MKNKGLLKSVLVMAIIFTLMIVGTATAFAASTPYISDDSATITTGTSKHITMKTALGNTVADSKVVWSSSDESIATVSSGGYVKGIKAGSATIYAEYKEVTYTCDVTIKNAKLSATSATITTGTSKHLTLKSALGNAISDSNIAWRSSDTSVATVSSGGYVKGIKAGSATIYAPYKGKTYYCKVTVKNAKLSATSVSVDAGGSAKHVTMSSALGNAISDTNITWKSSNTSIATVSAKGYIRGVKAGSATITATYKGIAYTCKVTVKNPAKLSDTSITIMPKDTYHLSLKNVSGGKTISDSYITWKSSNTSVATVSANGYIRGVATGSATISAVYKNVTYKATVKVIKSDYTVAYSSMTLNKLDGEMIPVTYTGDDYIRFEIVSGSDNILADFTEEWNGDKTNIALVALVKTGSAKIRVWSDGTEGYREVSITIKADQLNEDTAASVLANAAYYLIDGVYWQPTSIDIKDAYYYTGVKNCSDSVGMIRFTYTINTTYSPISGTKTYCVHMITSDEVSSTSGTKHTISSSTIKSIEAELNALIDYYY